MNAVIKIVCVYTTDKCFSDFLNRPQLTERDIIAADKFKEPADKTLRIASAYLKRKYVGEWTVEKNGKPVCDNGFFNVSHTDGLVVIALGDKPLGVDAEKIRPIDEKLKRYVCSEEEYSKAMDDERFFTVWTLKESLVKAEGEGLTDVKSIPSFGENGIKLWKGEMYRSKTVLFGGYALSVTVKGGQPFEVQVVNDDI